MVTAVRSLGLQGISGYEVTVECFLSGGLPAFDIVGLGDTAVKESRERVRAAVKNCGVKFPVSRITVNLAPAGRKKEGTLYDLPILLGILACAEEIKPPAKDAAFVGELSLTGTLRAVNGVLPMAMAAVRAGIRTLYVPAANAAEATLADGVTVYGVPDVVSLVQHLKGEKKLLPDMTRKEALEATEIWSVAGLTDSSHPMLLHRPFRAPHHTLSASAMTGGGQTPKPGEISLAHHGVLFLDELPEFHRDVLEVLRAPIEDGEVTITRAAGSITLPSRFMLVGAMNPCRCGWYGHPSGRCRCTKQQVEKYVEKISGPMLDRMDLHVNVPSVEFEAMRRREKAESSADVKARVNAARDIQKQRFSGTNITCNAQMTPAMVGEFCTLDAAGEKLLKGAFERLGLTARSHDRLLRVARTIADLDGSEKIEAHHLAEAIQYRNTDILQG